MMGSEGYLISQFLALRTNHRTDRWGGALENRARFPLAVVRRVRAAVGPDFLIVYRHSVLDLVEGGLAWDETVWVAEQVAQAGADLLSTGFGWHEAKVPTIAGVVPHAAFAEHIGRLKAAVPLPVTASNRINSPAVAERLIARGDADLVSMARPLLADAEFANKAIAGTAERHHHVHRLQPGLPRPLFREPGHHLPRQPAGGARGGVRAAPARAASASPWWAAASRASSAPSRRRGAGTR